MEHISCTCGHNYIICTANSKKTWKRISISQKNYFRARIHVLKLKKIFFICVIQIMVSNNLLQRNSLGVVRYFYFCKDIKYKIKDASSIDTWAHEENKVKRGHLIRSGLWCPARMMIMWMMISQGAWKIRELKKHIVD